MGKYLNRFFSKYYVRLANKHMKRHLTSLVIREMQIKTRANYDSMPTVQLNKEDGQYKPG